MSKNQDNDRDAFWVAVNNWRIDYEDVDKDVNDRLMRAREVDAAVSKMIEKFVAEWKAGELDGFLSPEATKRAAELRKAAPAAADGPPDAVKIAEWPVLSSAVRRSSDELDKLRAAVSPFVDRQHPLGQLSNESSTDFACRLIADLAAKVSAAAEKPAAPTRQSGLMDCAVAAGVWSLSETISPEIAEKFPAAIKAKIDSLRSCVSIAASATEEPMAALQLLLDAERAKVDAVREAVAALAQWDPVYHKPTLADAWVRSDHNTLLDAIRKVAEIVGEPAATAAPEPPDDRVAALAAVAPDREPFDRLMAKLMNVEIDGASASVRTLAAAVEALAREVRGAPIVAEAPRSKPASSVGKWAPERALQMFRSWCDLGVTHREHVERWGGFDNLDDFARIAVEALEAALAREVRR